MCKAFKPVSVILSYGSTDKYMHLISIVPETLRQFQDIAKMSPHGCLSYPGQALLRLNNTGTKIFELYGISYILSNLLIYREISMIHALYPCAGCMEYHTQIMPGTRDNISSLNFFYNITTGYQSLPGIGILLAISL